MPLTAAVLVPALLFGAISLGLRVPSLGLPGGATFDASVDYATGVPGGLTPLRERFIEDTLGGIIRPLVPATGPALSSPPEPALPSPPSVIEHPLVNDDFDEAYRVGSVPFSARTNNSEATRQSGEQGCSPVASRTVWYRFRAPENLGLIADTFGTDQAISLGVFSGRELSTLTEIGCSTNARGNAYVPFRAVAGTVYHFQIASVASADVVFDLRAQGITAALLPEDGRFAAAGGAITSDGRWWAFNGVEADPGLRSSECAGLLLPTDTGCRTQAYVYDRVTRKVVLVSIRSADGEPGNGISNVAGISAGGRHVAIWSTATNLVSSDRNTCYVYQVPGQCWDVFVHDRDADGNGRFDETFPGARRTVRVSVSSNGREGNGWSGLGLLSADGRYVAFQSEASNLVPGDFNGVGDAFVHDRDADGNGRFDETFPGARRTIRVSVSSDGDEAMDVPLRAARVGAALERREFMPLEHGNHILSISNNGRFTMFRSPAPNLVAGDTNGVYDVFVHDLERRTTVRVNVSSRGLEANKGSRLHNSFPRTVSDDGRFAIFISDATNLVPNDTNGAEDLFLRDLFTGATTMLTRTWDGGPAVEPMMPVQDVILSGLPMVQSIAALSGDVFPLSELNHTMTPDGRAVYFSSGAPLVPEDENQARDIYVRDLYRGTISLVSVSTEGVPGNASSNWPFVSIDGSIVGFSSSATNLTGEPPPLSGTGAAAFYRLLDGEP